MAKGVFAIFVAEGHAEYELPVHDAEAYRFPRDLPAPSTSPSYRTLLATLRTGKRTENCLFLHGYPSTWPHKVEDFASTLAEVMDREKIECLGPYQFNHVWMQPSLRKKTFKWWERYRRSPLKGKEAS